MLGEESKKRRMHHRVEGERELIWGRNKNLEKDRLGDLQKNNGVGVEELGFEVE